MVVGSSSNWYACHWYMGAYFTRLADLRSLQVCYLTLLSPSFFSFPLVRVFSTDYFSPFPFLSFFLPPSLALLLSFFPLVLLSSSTSPEIGLPIWAVNYAYPLLRYLTCLWLEWAGAESRSTGKKVARRARRYGEPLTTVSNPHPTHGIMTMAGQNLLSKRS